ncbi:MAG TPA: tripartite tricarboxylate transporter substrate binding protein [Xanthobacteraceae bacterium]|nr:tripartite tricarboxylate transporter substrate binding protein [Xanthobacteraceae bacterium]
MKFPRRTFLHLAAGVAALPAVSRAAWAQSYPARPVRMMVGYPAGYAPDIVARLVAQSLSDRLGQQFVVENRPGAGSNIATELVVRASADGYMLLLLTSTNAVNASLYTNLNFNVIRDIVPVARIGGTPFVLVVNPSLPAKTVPELIAYAKANPAKINVASNGIGTTPHVAFELFKMMTGTDMVHVPYRGNYMTDLLGGQVQAAFSPIASVLEYIRTGKLRALAVTPATRQEALPDVPAVAEFAPGYEASGWYGIGAPSHTPTEVVDKLNRGTNAALAEPQMKTRFADLGLVALTGSPADFGNFIAAETDKWGKVIREANIKLE